LRERHRRDKDAIVRIGKEEGFFRDFKELSQGVIFPEKIAGVCTKPPSFRDNLVE
jgi:hypothetical protein